MMRSDRHGLALRDEARRQFAADAHRLALDRIATTQMLNRKYLGPEYLGPIGCNPPFMTTAGNLLQPLARGHLFPDDYGDVSANFPNNMSTLLVTDAPTHVEPDVAASGRRYARQRIQNLNRLHAVSSRALTNDVSHPVSVSTIDVDLTTPSNDTMGDSGNAIFQTREQRADLSRARAIDVVPATVDFSNFNKQQGLPTGLAPVLSKVVQSAKDGFRIAPTTILKEWLKQNLADITDIGPVLVQITTTLAETAKESQALVKRAKDTGVALSADILAAIEATSRDYAFIDQVLILYGQAALFMSNRADREKIASYILASTERDTQLIPGQQKITPPADRPVPIGDPGIAQNLLAAFNNVQPLPLDQTLGQEGNVLPAMSNAQHNSAVALLNAISPPSPVSAPASNAATPPVALTPSAPPVSAPASNAATPAVAPAPSAPPVSAPASAASTTSTTAVVSADPNIADGVTSANVGPAAAPRPRRTQRAMREKAEKPLPETQPGSNAAAAEELPTENISPALPEPTVREPGITLEELDDRAYVTNIPRTIRPMLEAWIQYINLLGPERFAYELQFYWKVGCFAAGTTPAQGANKAVYFYNYLIRKTPKHTRIQIAREKTRTVFRDYTTVLAKFFDRNVTREITEDQSNSAINTIVADLRNTFPDDVDAVKGALERVYQNNIVNGVVIGSGKPKRNRDSDVSDSDDDEKKKDKMKKKNTVTLPVPTFVKEHTKLIDTLYTAPPKKLKREAAEQSKELSKELSKR